MIWIIGLKTDEGLAMYIVYKDYEKWINEHKNWKEPFDNMLDYLMRGIKRQIDALLKKLEENGIDASNVHIGLSEPTLKQVLIDSYDDLIRLKNFHPIKSPNPIKEISYIVYWFVKRKPIVLMSDEILVNGNLPDDLMDSLAFLNEFFAVKLLLNAAFTGKKQECKSVPQELSLKQEQTLRNYLLYYLVYRLSSPKSLEAILLASTIHPIWEVKSMIWN